MPAHNPPLLMGNVDDRDQTIADLRQENKNLESSCQHLETLLAQEKRRAEGAVRKLRTQLSPLYGALQALFGDMDEIGGEEAGGSGPAAKWDAIKSKMPPRHRECIDLLLLQGKMRRTQIASALKMDYSNCTKNVIRALLRAGWLVANGNELMLKQL